MPAGLGKPTAYSKRDSMAKVRELMNRNPCVVSVEATLEAIVDMMTYCGCEQIPVVDEESKLVGIITRRDVKRAKRSAARGEHSVTAGRFMTHSPVTVTPETPADEAATLLNAYRYDSLPVVDNGLLVGIISVGSFLGAFLV